MTGRIHFAGPPTQLLGSPPAHWASTQAVSMLTAAPSVAIFTGVAGPAAPAITLVVWQAGTGDHSAYLAAGGMLTAAAMPILTQVRHWGRERVVGPGDRRGMGSPTPLMSSPACSPVHVRPSPS